MKPAPTPHNEKLRQDVLDALDYLHKGREERFERIIDITKVIFDVPVVLLSIIDSDTQWFKAARGFEKPCVARSISFCGHTIHDNQPLVIEDALADERFHDNPLVLGSPFIRFYAGAPLIVAGNIRLGALCLIDTQPRTLDAVEQLLLSKLAEITRDELLRLPAPDRAQLEAVIAGSDTDSRKFSWLSKLAGLSDQ